MDEEIVEYINALVAEKLKVGIDPVETRRNIIRGVVEDLVIRIDRAADRDGFIITLYDREGTVYKRVDT